MQTKLPILPGAMLGVLGGGQLGLLFTNAAHAMGYRVMVLDPDPHSPAGKIADVHVQAGYDDAEAIRKLAETCAAITTEFENIPAQTLASLAQHTRVCPPAEAVAITQNRSREKSWLREHGIPHVPFWTIESAEDIAAGMAHLGGEKFVLKVSRFGYDGKGQAVVNNLHEARAAFAGFGAQPCVLEAWFAYRVEASVVLARNDAGQCAVFPAGRNVHVNGILHTTIVPSSRTMDEAQMQTLATRIADELNYVGVLAVEFFVGANAALAVNEIAPRTHNSGHYTLDACVTDQFEQQVRVLCGLPFGSTKLLTPAAMVNLLGDFWQDGEPAWQALLSNPDLKLHLYAKQQARIGRKMGHFTILGEVGVKLAETLAESASDASLNEYSSEYKK